jgi:hypothetical protein
MEIQICNINGDNFATASNVYEVYEKSGDKNDFEKVVDGLILERYSDDKDLKEYINSLPKENKRLAILSTLSDDNVLWKQISELVKKKQSSYERLKGIYNFVKEYVKIADVDRKGKGEIHTPFKELAEPMVKLVEKYDPEFWKNKNHKVLDSSAGYGTFLILAAYKFMVGLKDEFPDEEERFKWIVENCLYYGELQARSVFSWLLAIDPFDEYETNIYWGDFLSEDFDRHMKEIWRVEYMDLILKNPPYQKLKETEKNKSSKNPKTQPLWHLFVQKSLKILKEGGYMVMVHPGGWRDISGGFKEAQNILKERKILELHIFPFKSGLDLFKAKTNFDYYILNNKKNDGCVTEIHCENGTIERLNLLDLDYIPGENISMINNLFAKNDEDLVNMISDSSYHTQQGEKKGFLSKVKTDKFNLPVVYMVSYKNEPSFWHSSINKGHFGNKKVIWANGSSGVIIDINGDYGLTQFSRAIVDEPENLENIKKALESERFIKEVMLFKNGLGHKYNNKVISMLKKDFWREFI